MSFTGFGIVALHWGVELSCTTLLPSWVYTAMKRHFRDLDPAGISDGISSLVLPKKVTGGFH